MTVNCGLETDFRGAQVGPMTIGKTDAYEAQDTKSEERPGERVILINIDLALKICCIGGCQVADDVGRNVVEAYALCSDLQVT